MALARRPPPDPSQMMLIIFAVVNTGLHFYAMYILLRLPFGTFGSWLGLALLGAMAWSMLAIVPMFKIHPREWGIHLPEFAEDLLSSYVVKTMRYIVWALPVVGGIYLSLNGHQWVGNILWFTSIGCFLLAIQLGSWRW